MSIDRSPGTAGRVTGALLGLVLVVIALVVSVSLAFVLRRPEPPAPPPPLRLSLNITAEVTPGGGPDYPFGLALAADGRRLVLPAARAGHHQLFELDLTSGQLQPLDHTDGGVLPFWSPDGRSIGFFADGALRLLHREDGRLDEVAAAPAPGGGVWLPGGDIVFAPDARGLMRRSADGQVTPLTRVDPSTETHHRYPQVLGDGAHVVFFVQSGDAARRGIWLASLDAPDARVRLVTADAHGLAVGDVLFYASGQALVAQMVDLDSRRLRGQPALVGNRVGQGPEQQLFATAGGDVLVFGPPGSGLRELRWVDRQGTPLGVVGEPMAAWDVRIAPRGQQVAVARVDPQLQTLDIWTYDGDRPLPRRLSPAIDADETPAWSHDAARLAWVTGRRTVTVRPSSADRPEYAAAKLEHPVKVSSWSPDGRAIVVSATRPATGADILLVSPDEGGSNELREYVASPFHEISGVVSPDGRRLAYASDESGRFEIYLDAFPRPTGRTRLTLGGGMEPRWSAGGGELFFRRGAAIHVVRPDLRTGEALSTERLFDALADIRSFDVSPDGQRFLLNLPAPDEERGALSVIVGVEALISGIRAAAEPHRP